MPASVALASVVGSSWDTSTLHLGKGDSTQFHKAGQDAHGHACLILYSGDTAGRRFDLDAPTMTLGRAPACSICIDDPSLSRCHAELAQDEAGTVLRDRGSSNGTRRNGHRLQEPARLADGDLVQMGRVAFKFYERQSTDALLHDRIYRMATVDAGTEVYTKRYLMEVLERELRRAQRRRRPLSVLCLDLDHFKSVNDRYGHNAGDQVLRGSAAAVRGQLRAADVLGRVGGEEFAVVLPETELAHAVLMAERVRQAVADVRYRLALADAPDAPPVTHRQTVSVGAAQWAPGIADASALLGAADLKLYAAKRGGRNCVSS